LFITLEGTEGSGKTTQVKAIERKFSELGLLYVTTREPGGTRIGKKIREILLNPDHIEIKPLTELLLYCADRVQHIEEIIRPALQDNKIVICDRFYDATVAYQGYARKINMDLISSLHHSLFGNIQPDLTLLFDLPVEVGLKRTQQRIKIHSNQILEYRFENETLNFHHNVRHGYLELADHNPHRFVIIDANSTPENVTQMVWTAINNKFHHEFEKRLELSINTI